MLLRAPVSGDAAAVAVLLASRDLAAFGISHGTLENLRAEWGSSQFDLARDAIVAQAPDGALMGYAVAHRFGSFATVDRAREGQGIGSALLDWCERRQHELGRTEHRTSIPLGNHRAQALVTARGYELVRSNWSMASALERFAGGATSAGVTLRALDSHADAEAVHALDRAAFAAVAGESGDDFIEEHLSAHDLDQPLSRVAERGDRIVGFALTRRRTAESAAYIDILAVDPREQGRGIGRMLLVAVFAAARRAGLLQAQLGVSADNPTALRLYEGLGMERRAQLDIYERPIR